MKLTVEELNLILDSLGNQPFKKVYKLIEKIQQQAASQLNSETNGHHLNEDELQQTLELDKEIVS